MGTFTKTHCRRGESGLAYNEARSRAKSKRRKLKEISFASKRKNRKN